MNNGPLVTRIIKFLLLISKKKHLFTSIRSGFGSIRFADYDPWAQPYCPVMRIQIRSDPDSFGSVDPEV